MKKYLITALSGLACLMIGCSQGSTGDEQNFTPKRLDIYEDSVPKEAREEESKNSSEQVPEGKGRAAAGSELPGRENGCSAVIFENSDILTPGGGVFHISYREGQEDKLWYYDEFFTLERYMDGGWEELPMLNGLCGTTMYTEIQRNIPNSMELDWGTLYGPLEPGVYCAAKAVFPQRTDILNSLMGEAVPEDREYLESTGPDTNDGKIVYAVFELKDGLGLSLEVEDVKNTGLTMKFVRNGGSPSGELQYGSSYWLEQLKAGSWYFVEYKDPEYEAVWTQEAYPVSKEVQTEKVDWKWLYGELSSGQYRFCKDVTDFRGAGDYDQYVYSAEFTIP